MLPLLVVVKHRTRKVTKTETLSILPGELISARLPGIIYKGNLDQSQQNPLATQGLCFPEEQNLDPEWDPEPESPFI